MKLLLLGITLLFSSLTFADAISVDNLQGKWKIVKMGNEAVTDMNDVWEFKDKKWIVWSEGKALSPDPYEIKGNVIDLGYSKITVLEKTSDSMRTETSGILYTFKKIK